MKQHGVLKNKTMLKKKQQQVAKEETLWFHLYKTKMCKAKSYAI